MADDNTHINNDTGKDDEWEAVPKKKKNTRDRPHHHHKKLQGDEFPSFLDSIPSYIHPPPPPLPPLATQSATDNHDDVAGDVLGSVEASTDDLVMILLVGFPGM